MTAALHDLVRGVVEQIVRIKFEYDLARPEIQKIARIGIDRVAKIIMIVTEIHERDIFFKRESAGLVIRAKTKRRSGQQGARFAVCVACGLFCFKTPKRNMLLMMSDGSAVIDAAVLFFCRKNAFPCGHSLLLCEKNIFLSISFGQAEYNLSMNKRWTEQKYVIYFLLSVMVLGVCGGVSYGVSCCQTGEVLSEGMGIAWTAEEADKRYVPYTASEQRVIEVELLAFEEEQDGGTVPRSDGGAGMEAGTTDSTVVGAEEGEQTEGGVGAAGQAEEETEAQPQENADTGAADPAGGHTETAPELEDGADVQTGGWGIIVSEEDYEALLRIVQAEAGNEDTKGKILVANVVLNRVVDERFPNSVYDVVFQRAGGKAQFSPVASGSYYKVVVTEDTREAVDRALAGEDYSEGALYFAARRYAGSSQMRWFDECLTKLFSYGGHEFFTS